MFASGPEQRREILAQMVLERIRRQPETLLFRAFEANSTVHQTAEVITFHVGDVPVALVRGPGWWTPGRIPWHFKRIRSPANCSTNGCGGPIPDLRTIWP